ncbi:MAG TPA: M28 family metallopeptidase [Gemmatimonadaceae bacterium]|nr:M28 family metallopeptidase [Gemmatimonadaceae bacterium]
MIRRLALGALALAAACTKTDSATSGSGTASLTPAVTAAAESISAPSLLQHIRNLADDSLEGRGPGTPGEQKAVAYIEGQFKALGLAPGNPDGTYRQKVELIGYTPNPTASFTANGRTIRMTFKDDFVASSRHDRPETKVENSDIVFVGYGVEAPEYGWDDFKGVDVKGKTVIVLINDPAVPAPGRAAPTGEMKAEDMDHLDSTMFRGKAMTYYGRWTYKYEEATRKGAAAVFIVHETVPAAYGWNVVRSSWSGEQLDVISPDAAKRVPVEGWITLEKAKQLFAAAGQDWDSLRKAATTKEFKPVPLNAKANVSVKTTVRRMDSWNVVARLEGTAKKDEYVVYTAHHDHLGRDTSRKGDQINNGALDNASGVATVLEIAKAFTKLPEKPSRSILFLMVAAEESGLLGAKYYANNPLYPLTRTVANINIDGINQWGKTSDFTVVGLGNSDLDDVLTDVLKADGRTVRSDPEPEKGFYYRSDHFEFAKKGVPALDPDAGVTYIGKDSTYGMTKRDEYTKNDYHGPTDEIKPDWDLSGAIDDARVLFRVGYLVAQRDALAQWKPGTEFKALRDSMMKGR